MQMTYTNKHRTQLILLNCLTKHRFHSTRVRTPHQTQYRSTLAQSRSFCWNLLKSTDICECQSEGIQ